MHTIQYVTLWFLLTVTGSLQIRKCKRDGLGIQSILSLKMHHNFNINFSFSWFSCDWWSCGWFVKCHFSCYVHSISNAEKRRRIVCIRWTKKITWKFIWKVRQQPWILRLEVRINDYGDRFFLSLYRDKQTNKNIASDRIRERERVIHKSSSCYITPLIQGN